MIIFKSVLQSFIFLFFMIVFYAQFVTYFNTIAYAYFLICGNLRNLWFHLWLPLGRTIYIIVSLFPVKYISHRILHNFARPYSPASSLIVNIRSILINPLKFACNQQAAPMIYRCRYCRPFFSRIVNFIHSAPD